MSDFKPNHICKNINCTKGTDGNRKHYYACNFCARTSAWRSVACCIECYDEYTKQVIEARSKGKKVSVKPERTDMTEKEFDDFMNKPIDEVIEETKEELKDFSDEDGNINFSEAVDKINEELDMKSSKRKNKTK